MTTLIKLCAVISIFLFSPCEAVEIEVVNMEGRLVEDLLQNYGERGSGLARPLDDSNDILPVSIKFILNEFIDMDDRKMMMEVSGIIRAEWNDTYLTWNPADYGGIKALPLQSNNIYLPIIMRTSSAAELSPIFSRDADTQSMIWVDYTGAVRATFSGIISTDCTMTLLTFPFDTQICTFIFQVWQHTDKQVLLTLNPFEPFRLDVDAAGNQAMFSIERMEVETRLLEFDLVYFSAVAYKVYMRRRSEYFTFSLVLPCAMMSAVILSIFFMPYKKQRVYFAITFIWTLRLFHQSVTSRVPVTNEPIQILKFTTFQITLGILATIESVFMVYWLDADKVNDVPRWMRQFHAASRRVTMFFCWFMPNDHEEIERADREEERLAIEAEKKINELGITRPPSKHSLAMRSMRSISSLFHVEAQNNRDDKKLDDYTRLQRKQRRDDNWYDCVATIDRFCFIMGLLLTFGFAASYL